MRQWHVFSFLVGLWLLSVAQQSALAQPASLYEGEVPVASQSAEDRAAALPAALAQVLVKVGGRASAAEAAREADAASLLQQYRYRQDAGSQAQLMIARFDAEGVRRLLGSGGAGIWPAQRPEPILWLAIDDGSGPRIVAQDAAAAVAPLTSRASQRGLRIRLPAYDAQDRAIVIARDLPSGEAYSVDTASRRYGGPVLMGWMRRGDGGWVADWRLRDGDADLARWQSIDAQAAAVLAAGGDGVADALSRRYEQLILSGPAGHYPVAIEGLSDADDYARAMAVLRRQPIVRALSPRVLRGDRLELDAELGAGVEGLARLLEGSGLVLVTLGDGETPSVFALAQ